MFPRRRPLTRITMPWAQQKKRMLELVMAGKTQHHTRQEIGYNNQEFAGHLGMLSVLLKSGKISPQLRTALEKFLQKRPKTRKPESRKPLKGRKHDITRTIIATGIVKKVAKVQKSPLERIIEQEIRRTILRTKGLTKTERIFLNKFFEHNGEIDQIQLPGMSNEEIAKIF